MPEPWYKNAIIYAVDVGRFTDSNADGCGDFPGLTDRLGYLGDLGVTCLWLLPFYPSPGRDNDYDIKSYYDVDARFGTLDDFIHFLHKAGERSIRVVLDLVMNHTSAEHPWFQAARHDPHTRYRNYYTWADSPPPTPPGQGSIFPDQEATVWTYDEVARAYYYHRFYHFQPDLDLTNSHVQEEVKKVLDFWLSFGISGFRIDAASHMIERQSVEEDPQQDTHELLRNLRTTIATRRPEAALIGEADVEPEKLVKYFGDGDELNLLFNFVLNNYLYLALARGEAAPIVRTLRQLPATPTSCQWANFVRNLDEVDLERLTDADREEVYAAFAPEEDMRIYGRGIRRRIAPMLGGDRRRLELVFSLLFSLPGVPTLVYGDEIGMGEDLSQEGRNAVRSPMQWADEKNAGFSDGSNKDLVQSVIAEGPFAYQKVNVADQQEDKDSLLNWMKRLIHLRRQCKAVGYGNWHLLDVDAPQVLAHRCTWKDLSILAVHNLSDEAFTVALDLSDQRGRRLTGLLGDDTRHMLEGGDLEIEMAPYGYRWYRLGGERS